MSFGVDKSAYDLCMEALGGRILLDFLGSYSTCLGDDFESMSGETDRAFDQSILCFCAKRMNLTSSEAAALSIACYMNLARERSV